MKNALYSFLYAARNILNAFLHFREVSILAYHSISDENLSTVVSAKEFERQILYLKQKGFSFVMLERVVAWTKADGKEEQKGTSLTKAVAVTFDDGYADFETTALPILEKYNVPVTLFMMDTHAEKELLHAELHNKIPLLSSEALERVRKNPLVEIGFHSRTHANLAKFSGQALRDEVNPRSDLPGLRSDLMRYFAYPGGNYSDEAVQEVQKAGYEAAVSIKRRLVKKGSNCYLLPRTVVTHGMRPWIVGVHVTKAIDWYRALTGLVR